MIEDRQHNLWVTQGENGIYRLSVDNKSKHFLKQEKGMTIVDLYEDNYGDIYLATIGKGLLKYNQPAEEFIPILYKGKQKPAYQIHLPDKPKTSFAWARTGKAPRFSTSPNSSSRITL